MKLAYAFRLPLVVANLLLVLIAMTFMPIAIWIALVTAQLLFIYYVSSPECMCQPERSLGMGGGIFNYIGVLYVAITSADTLMPMALMGGIFMLSDVIMHRQD